MFSAWILLSLPVFASALTLTAPNIIPSVWTLLGAPPSGSSIQWTLVLQSANLQGLESHTQQVALSPTTPWLSEDDVASYVGATSEAKSAVEAALQTIPGATYSFSKYGDKVTVTSTVGSTATFFSTVLSLFQHTSGASVVRTHSLTIPSSISQYVTDVYPLLTFGHYTQLGRVERFHKPSQAHRYTKKGLNLGLGNGPLGGLLGGPAPPGCNVAGVTSACIRSLYGYDKVQPAKCASSPPAIGVLAYIGQSYSQLDLAEYLNKFRPDAAGYSFTVNQTLGALNNQLLPGVEADLDTQTVAGIVSPLPSTFYDIGTQLTNGDLFLITFQNFLAMAVKDRPSVITISYGSEENQFTAAQAQTMCNAALQLTCQGMTIVVSSGDSGVNGQGSTTDTCPPFIPTYPSGCPYVLSVGATQGFSPETAAGKDIAGFYGGAGFSNIFPTPNYQEAAVQNYLNYLNSSNPSQSRYFNTNGRGYPDVSAQGAKQDIIYLLLQTTVGGTSASAPIVASGFTLANWVLASKSCRTIGYIHPLLYSTQASQGAWTDITAGGSYGCANTTVGFPAGPGWDPSTGVGTPNLPKLLASYGVTV